MTRDFELIEDQRGLEEFSRLNSGLEWMCFDTEFVGEKRFLTRLCLIQVATVNGNFLIDPFKLEDLGPFLSMIQDPEMIKVTHAGDNDYRILFEHYKVVPRNIFDTQIAAAFVGYNHPVGLRKLVSSELNIRMKKGYTVADWESRPFKRKQLHYALDDIQPLHELWQKLDDKLGSLNRRHWAGEEFLELENPDYYVKDPHREALGSRLIRSLSPREQIFLIRLYNWREQLASQKNHSKEMVLPNKMVPHIVRSIQSGKDALRNNRRIPGKIAERHGEVFEELFRKDPTREEKKILAQITRNEPDEPREEIIIEMLYQVLKHRCLDVNISPNIVLHRNMLKKLRGNEELLEEILSNGWRGELLGHTFIQWLREFDRLKLHIDESGAKLFLPN